MAHNAQVPPQALATPAAPPTQAAPPPPPPAEIHPAPPVLGAAQPAPAPAPSRNRNPRGPVPAPVTTSGPGIPALLEIGAANPFSTDFFRSQNYYVASALHMFHVLGLCDLAMSSTHRFLQSAPLWLPIVSQYYISVLWIYHILNVRASAGYANPQESEFVEHMTRYLHVENCLIPGPLVPFFQALAASSSAFDWLGDVLPGFPSVGEMLTGNTTSYINENWLRIVPFPAAILDQLHYWTFWTVPANQSRYANFEWFRSVFQQNVNASGRFRLSPNTTAVLYVSNTQHDAAHIQWLSILGPNAGSVYTRHNAVSAAAFDSFFHFCGFHDANANQRTVVDIFTAVARTMQSYSLYFSGSVPLKGIATAGIGAGIPRAVPLPRNDIRNWIYPNGYPAQRLSNSQHPIHPIPALFAVRFHHADHELEEIAEQYAVTTHVNVDLGHANNAPQHGYQQIANTVAGTMWTMTAFRSSGAVSVHDAYGMTISSRYHHSTQLRPN